MMKEEFYDREIAPVLAQLAKKCEAEGLSFVAMCEFGPNETGSTFSIRKDVGVELTMARLAMTALGNADRLIGTLRRYSEEYGHNSVMLELLNRTPLLTNIPPSKAASHPR